MMVFLAIVLVLVAVIAVLLWQKVRISYELNLENFKIIFKFKITMFGKILFDSDNKKESINEPAEKEQKRKMSLSDINKIKDMAAAIIPPAWKVIKSSVGIDAFETDIRIALADPMDNGIAYGLVCGIMNNLYAPIMRKCPNKEYFLDIMHDFKSGEGLILENKGTLYVRPGKMLSLVLAIWISNKKLRTAVADIKRLFTKEENEK